MRKNKYGAVYKSVEFISKIIPKTKKKISIIQLEYINAVLKFLMDLDNVQQSNPSVTLLIHASDGIWVNYNLERQFLIKPSQKYITILIWGENTFHDAMKKEKELFKDVRTTSYDAEKYHLNKDELIWIIESLNNKKVDKKYMASKKSTSRHPRYISGDVRQFVLSEFEASGRVCNGVYKKTKKHKVKKGDAIEFDHILPYSKGGTSSYKNIQILCQECNRIKSDSAC